MEEETGVPGENHRPVASYLQTLSHKVVSSTPRHERRPLGSSFMSCQVKKALWFQRMSLNPGQYLFCFHAKNS